MQEADQELTQAHQDVPEALRLKHTKELWERNREGFTMPTELPNGIAIFNATPHNLNFWNPKTRDVTVAKSDMTINTRPVETVQEKWNGAEFVTVEYYPDDNGLDLIKFIREEYPGVLIVGSVLSAMAYPGEVVASIPLKGGDRLRSKTNSRRVCSDRFTTFKQEI